VRLEEVEVLADLVVKRENILVLRFRWVINLESVCRLLLLVGKPEYLMGWI